MTQIQLKNLVWCNDSETSQDDGTSDIRDRIEGEVLDVRSDDDPRLPELATDDEIETISDGSDLLRVRVGTVDYQTILDRVLGRTREIDDEVELLADLGGIDIEPGDDILVDGIVIESDDDPRTADLWLAAEESALARIPRDAPRSVGSLDLRDDQLDDRMDINPFLTRRQRIEILIERTNRTLSSAYRRLAS